jgi:hypothetical protein
LDQVGTTFQSTPELLSSAKPYPYRLPLAVAVAMLVAACGQQYRIARGEGGQELCVPAADSGDVSIGDDRLENRPFLLQRGPGLPPATRADTQRYCKAAAAVFGPKRWETGQAIVEGELPDSNLTTPFTLTTLYDGYALRWCATFTAPVDSAFTREYGVTVYLAEGSEGEYADRLEYDKTVPLFKQSREGIVCSFDRGPSAESYQAFTHLGARLETYRNGRYFTRDRATPKYVIGRAPQKMPDWALKPRARDGEEQSAAKRADGRMENLLRSSAVALSGRTPLDPFVQQASSARLTPTVALYTRDEAMWGLQDTMTYRACMVRVGVSTTPVITCQDLGR